MKWEPGDPKIAAVFSERRGTSIGRERGRVSPLLGSPTAPVPVFPAALGLWGCLCPTTRRESRAKRGRWPGCGLVGSTVLSAGESFLLFLSAGSFRNSSVVGRSRREPDRPVRKVQDLCKRVSLCWAELPAGAVLLHFQNDTHPQCLNLR